MHTLLFKSRIQKTLSSTSHSNFFFIRSKAIHIYLNQQQLLVTFRHPQLCGATSSTAMHASEHKILRKANPCGISKKTHNRVRVCLSSFLPPNKKVFFKLSLRFCFEFLGDSCKSSLLSLICRICPGWPSQKPESPSLLPILP